MAEEIPLFPLNTVLFPGMPLPLHIFEPRYREMIGLCSTEDRPFGVILIREGTEVGDPATPFEVGTLARIVGVDRMPDGRMNIITVGTSRFRLLGYSTEKRPYIVGDVEPLDDAPPPDEGLAQVAEEVGGLIQRYLTLIQAAAEQELTTLQIPSNPEELSYLVGANLRIHNPERQHLLEMVSTAERLQAEKAILERETKTIEEFLQRRSKGSLGPFSRN
jgi:Lon protease-like protein